MIICAFAAELTEALRDEAKAAGAGPNRSTAQPGGVR